MNWFQAAGIFIPMTVIWNYVRRRGPKKYSLINSPEARSLPISFGFWDYFKAVVAWLFLFSRTFSVPPGLYYLGEKKNNSPILVSGNFFLTLFLLAHSLRKSSVRLLVIDTEGINVWCSAGKGNFSADKIIYMVKSYNLIEEESRLDVILPKFSLSGVKLAELKKAGINPIIGPLYAEDVTRFLAEDRMKHCRADTVKLGVKHRFFTAVPTSIQFFYNYLGLYVVTLGWFPASVIWIAAALAFAYPILFPYLPGRQFAVKGSFFGVVVAVFMVTFLIFRSGVVVPIITWYAAFIIATAILIGLSYTGNSPVSNYTLVRKEIARYLPIVIVLYGFSLLIYSLSYLGVI